MSVENARTCRRSSGTARGTSAADGRRNHRERRGQLGGVQVSIALLGLGYQETAAVSTDEPLRRRIPTPKGTTENAEETHVVWAEPGRRIAHSRQPAIWTLIHAHFASGNGLKMRYRTTHEFSPQTVRLSNST
jgi:hypothetical protein